MIRLQNELWMTNFGSSKGLLLPHHSPTINLSAAGWSLSETDRLAMFPPPAPVRMEWLRGGGLEPHTTLCRLMPGTAFLFQGLAGWYSGCCWEWEKREEVTTSLVTAIARTICRREPWIWLSGDEALRLEGPGWALLSERLAISLLRLPPS